MIAISSSRSLPSRFLGWSLLLLVGAMLFASCGQRTAEPISPQVAAKLDIANNAIADLTGDSTADIPRAELMQAVSRAQAAGTTLRIVVAAPGAELVSAKSIVDRYGGTAISYQADRPGFEGASRDMSSGQLDRAVDAAKGEPEIADSATAFVGVVEAEGLEKPSRTFSNKAMWFLLIPAATFMVWGAWSYFQARKRRIRRHAAFASRKAVLTDWAAQLAPEVDALRPLVATSPDDSAQQDWHDAQQFVSKVMPALESANTAGDLDMAEMRIGRTAIKLRDLRRSLDA